MQISSTLQPYMATHAQRPTGRPACTTHSSFSDFFTRDEVWSSGPAGYSSTSSPYMRLSESYERWKAQMSGEDPLPDSKGLTEENLAYLREHYSGELGWEERMDALNTMQRMGILSSNQVQQACGGGMATMSFGAMQTTITMTPLQQSNPWETNWDVLFKGTPIAGFHTLDDILSWVDKTQDEPQAEEERISTQHLVDLRC